MFDIMINAKKINLGFEVYSMFSVKNFLLEYPDNDNLIMAEKQ